MNLLNRMKERFPAVDMEKTATAHNRVYVTLPGDQILEALAFAKNDLDFDHLCTITGLDNGEGFEFLYHLAEPEGVVMTLRYQTGRGDGVTIPSVLPIYEGATFYERELEGLLGVTVEGLPEGRQYPLPDNWPKGEYPMRKGWAPKGAGETAETAE